MNETLLDELIACFHHLSNDKSRIIVLTGSGPSLCAGADLNMMKSMVNYSKQENKKESKRIFDLYETISTCPKPVIGRINGKAN
jgi:methylglutaconyl-CoA hydratase